MKKNLVILFLVLLTIVNIAALVTIAYHRFHPKRSFHPMGRPETPESFIKQELDLTEEQAEEFKAHFKRSRTEMEPILDSLEVIKKQLMDEISADEPSMDRLDQLAGEIGTLQAAMQKKMILHLLKGKSLLTPEQQKKFFSLLREGLGRMEGMRDPGRMGKPPGRPDLKDGR
jgi:Spy/CpxP family protein refolding chaperone